MKAKRKQYKVMQIGFNQITEKDGKLTVDEEPRLILTQRIFSMISL